jgi:hypothetical protein
MGSQAMTDESLITPVLFSDAAVQSAYQAIAQAIDDICDRWDGSFPDHLAPQARSVAVALGQQPDAPIQRGQPTVWAAGILHAIAVVTERFDEEHPTPLVAADLYAAAQVSASATRRRSKQIRDRITFAVVEPPPPPMVSVNGLAIDAQFLPRSLRLQAIQQGLIPKDCESAN